MSIDQSLHPMRDRQPLTIVPNMPSNSVGAEGDVVLSMADGTYYQKVQGIWTANGGPGNGGGGSGAAQTVRNIATRCRHNYQLSTAATAVGSRTYHQNMGDDVASIQVVIGNWMANNNGESNGPALSTEYLAVEYPSGVYHLAKWSGADFTTCAAGANVITDPIPVSLRHGDGFWVHRVQIFPSDVQIPVSANAVIAPSSVEPVASYIWTNAQWTAVTDDPRAFVCGTAFTGGATGGAWTIYPLAVLGLSSVPSVVIYGDSRASGRNDASSNVAQQVDFGSWGMGEICRSLGRALPYTNCGCESDTIQSFAASHTLRAQLSRYHTHAHFQYGINDLTAGRTEAVIQAALQTAYGYVPSLKVSQSTIPPVTTSTDSWATVANQTVAASNGPRAALNTWILSKPAPLWAVFDVASVVEDPNNPGKWRGTDSVPAMPAAITSDGTHETPYAYQMIQRAGVIDPTLFV